MSTEPQSTELKEPEQDARLRCNGCTATYAVKWRGCTCIECDGTIGGEECQQLRTELLNENERGE